MYKLLGYNKLPDKGIDGFDHDFPTRDRVGIEIELENILFDVSEIFDNTKNIRKFWEVHDDGSLKDNGVEFVFRRPYGGSNISSALTAMDNLLGNYEDIRAGVRTSVHVHIDVLDMTQAQFQKLLFLYVLFERVLYRVGGYHRYSNNNCIPLGSSEVFANAIVSLGQTSNLERIYESFIQCGKYCGCNGESVFKHGRGSLEFRMHEGTTDIRRITEWCRLLIRMKRAALSIDLDINTLPETFSKTDPMQFISNVFLDKTDYVLSASGVPLNVLIEDLYDGIRNLQYIKEYEAIAKEGQALLEQVNKRYAKLDKEMPARERAKRAKGHPVVDPDMVGLADFINAQLGNRDIQRMIPRPAPADFVVDDFEVDLDEDDEV